jgi:hypothetical protein
MSEFDPPESEVRRFTEYAEAVFKPNKVLDRLGEGEVNGRQMEAIRAVYPETFAKIKDEFMEKLAKEKPMNVARDGLVKNKIALVLGAEIRPSLKKQNISYLQNQYTAAGESATNQMLGMAQAPSKTRKHSFKSSNDAQTNLDATLYRRVRG